ncbi:phytanoyl-CoA dioxygenase family protein [Aeoliella sp. SH292]|uniref:phytanoyl-CoA dioxygenase family protein n=1 Tax=Aeoliella sp. SH292 TaxID=3454464 RepID=UPI003F9AB4D2
MNMKPKLRPLWQRLPIMGGLAGLCAWKALGLPRSVLPRDFKSIVKNWDYEMFSMILKSRVLRAFIDQPAYFQMPKVIEPKAEVAPEYRMSHEQLKSFYTNGFIGPFDAFTPQQMKSFRDDLLAVENTKSETYGFVTPRDRHFEMPRMWNYMKHPAITERCAQILGPDLLTWRSQIFFKPPGSPTIQWHQASTFMVEDYQDPAIFPPDLSEIFQLTVWIAVDDTHHDNGCLRFMPGTHNAIRPLSFGGDEGFYDADFTLEYTKEEEARAVEIPVKPGQFIIFSERCIHGSGPNTTDRHRLAFNLRVIPTSVPVYTDKKYYRSVYNGGKYHLDKWGVAVLRGEDRYKLSRTIPEYELDRPGVATEVISPMRKAA